MGRALGCRIMTIRLTNTLSGKLEEFKPIRDGEVKMYHCGPTVYDYAHIGNLRAYVFADLLRRVFEYLDYDVRQVINVTDIGHLVSDGDEGEDKMTKALKRDGKSLTLDNMIELARFYFDAFIRDLDKLNIKKAHEYPFASEHISEEVELIKKLSDKGFTYTTSDGVYFDTSKDANYGRLGGLSGEIQTRIGINAEKKNPRDFALWKFNSGIGFDSELGKGFPGWHIECSAMSMKYLGETFDIHTGGIDHIPVHHNNEIAQSENATGKKFVDYWLHNNFITMESGKMAKSGDERITLHQLEMRDIPPLAYRYFLLQSHYRTQVNFSWDALTAAENAYRKLKTLFSTLPPGGSVSENYVHKFKEIISDDLNTPEVLALVWGLVGNSTISPVDKRATLLEFDRVLGLDLEHNEFELVDVPEEVEKLLTERNAARLAQNWEKADVIREKIRALGYEVKDTEDGQKLSKI